jgi:hypothetical protein
MPNRLTQFFNHTRDLLSLATPAWPLPFRRRQSNITEAERETFERYGETIIAMQVRGSFVEDPEHAGEWLKERATSRQRRESITFALEIVVVVLIGGEILLALWQEHLQSRSFDEQQQVLTNLQNSSAATAKTLTSLQSATESMNTILQMQLDAARKSEAQAERSAKAGEASAATASQSLHVSERAYVHLTPSLAKPPSAAEKPHYSVVISNTGRTPALELTARMTGFIGPSSLPSDEAYSKALDELSKLHRESESVGTLPAGQTAEEDTDSPVPLTQADVDHLSEGKTLLYIFAEVSYKDIFRQLHHTEICAFYQPASKAFSACHGHNNSD